MKKICSILLMLGFIETSYSGEMVSITCTPINGYANTPLSGNLKPGLGVEYFVHNLDFDIDNNTASMGAKLLFPLKASSSEFRFFWGDSLWLFDRISGRYSVNQIYPGGGVGASLESGICEKNKSHKAF